MSALAGAPLRIAVLIPVWNAARYIGETLDSVRAQTRAADEIVVVDDACEDDTVAVVQRWAARCTTPVRLLRQPNRGCAAARNRALRATDADLVATLDADDLFLPGHLARAEAAFTRYPMLALCFADTEIFSTRGVEQAAFLRGKPIKQLAVHEDDTGLRLIVTPPYVSLLSGNYIPVSTSVYRLSALRRVGLYDESLRNAADRDLNLRLSRTASFAYYAAKGGRKRIVPGSLSDPHDAARALEQKRHRFRVVEKMLARAEELSLTPQERRFTRRALAEHAHLLLQAARRLGGAAYWSTALELLRHGHLLSPWLAELEHLPAALRRRGRRLLPPADTHPR
jgi:glycosyltransferase involved in cell wall biosynthesis